MLVAVHGFFKIGYSLIESSLAFLAIYLCFKLADALFKRSLLDFICQVIFHCIDSGRHGRSRICASLDDVGIQVGNSVIKTACRCISIAVNDIICIVQTSGQGSCLHTSINDFINAVNSV